MIRGAAGRFWGVALFWLLICASPAVASGAQSLAVTSPTGFPAGGHPTYTTTITLDTAAGTPSTVTVTLAPGVLASVSANPSCVTGAPQYTPACQIGTGSATVPLPVPLTAYLVPPPQSSDLVGIDLVTSLPGSPVTHAGAQLVQTPAGAVATVLSLDLSSLGPEAGLISQMALTINGTLGGKPFTRMPTNCHPGSTTVTIAYAKRTETTAASPDFAPTGCASLPFAPKLSGTATVDAHDSGVAVSTTVTQAADEAASASTKLDLPWPTLAPNLSALSLQNTATSVGTASTVSPLLPTPLQGKAFFTGTPGQPTLTIRFPPPAVLTLVGTIDLGHHTVTFPNVPDVPVTQLTVTLFGGAGALLTAACDQPTGPLGGAFTGQNGASTTASRTLTLVGCPVGSPDLSGVSVTGLARGTPAISFQVTQGVGAAKIRSLTVTLPAGLTFARRGLRQGVRVRPAHSLRLDHGRLTITFIRPVAGAGVRLAGPALREAARLRRHRPAHLTLGVAVTDLAGRTTRLSAPGS